jgi:hypothetical protein
MDESSEIRTLKRWLLDDVAGFSRQRHRLWKRSIANTVVDLERHQWPAVYFGGTLRALLLGRLTRGIPNRPRDIDIVVKGPSSEELERAFAADTTRKTRFGGLHLRRFEWEFDVWPLQETYAFRNCRNAATFADLPQTTFFNLEAVAVDVWPFAGGGRNLYTADDSFFTAFLKQELEINNEENPFPELCVVRSLVLAASLHWQIGPRLSRYLAIVGEHLKEGDFVALQTKHYGRVELDPTICIASIFKIRRKLEEGIHRGLRLFEPAQMTLWGEPEGFSNRIRLKTLSELRKRVAKAQMRGEQP